MDCSIIIPVHNRASLTRQCLNRLLALSMSARPEIIVVDGASTDITPELLSGYGNQIRVVTLTDNRGFAASCNAGAEIATGSFLIFLNNDTLPQNGWLENLLEYAEEHPRAAMVGAKLLYPDDTVQHAGVVICQDRYPRHIYAAFPADHPAVNTSRRFQIVTAACALMRREMFIAFGGFDTRFVNGYEDVDLCLRMGAAGHEIHYCHTSVLHHLESVTRGLHLLGQNLQLYQERWLERVVPDEFRYYLEDGLIEVGYSLSYPIHFEISPLLSTLHGPARDARAEELLHLRALHSSRQRRELVELYAELADMKLARVLPADLLREANPAPAGYLGPSPSSPDRSAPPKSNGDEDLIYPDAENLMGGHFKEVGENIAHLLKTYGALEPTERVLEVGCGYGRIAFQLLHYLEGRGAYQGFDIDRAQVEWCQTKITPRYPNFRFQFADVYNKSYNLQGKQRASAFRFPYPDACFDFVFLASVFTHMLPEDMEHYLAEIARVLAPGGRCLITWFLLNVESRSRMSGAWNFQYDFGAYRSLDYKIPENAVAYDEEFVRALYRKYGLEITEQVGRGTWCGRETGPTFQDFLVADKTPEETRAVPPVAELYPVNPPRTLRTILPATTYVRVVAKGKIHPLAAREQGPLYSILMPVKNGALALSELLPRVLEQQADGSIEIVAVDSGSSDETIEILKQYEATILAIPPKQFNHGLTRNLAASYAHGDIFICLNQTALPADEHWLANLVAPLAHDQKLAGVCSRLLPRADADLLVRRDVLRDLNGAVESRDSVITNWGEYQALTPDELRYFINFHSVSAAIRPQVLERIPLPAVPLIGEDLAWAKLVLEAGYTVRYEASSVAFHSHAYSHTELLQRNFDDAVLNHMLVGRQIDAAQVMPGIVAAVADDWHALEKEPSLTLTELEALRVEAVMRRTAQWVGQWLGGHPDELPMDASAHLALTESLKRQSVAQATKDEPVVLQTED